MPCAHVFCLHHFFFYCFRFSQQIRISNISYTHTPAQIRRASILLKLLKFPCFSNDVSNSTTNSNRKYQHTNKLFYILALEWKSFSISNDYAVVYYSWDMQVYRNCKRNLCVSQCIARLVSYAAVTYARVRYTKPSWQ